MAREKVTAVRAPSPKPTRPRRPRLSAPEQDFVTIIVGPEKVRFVTHENLLVHYSPYFQGAFRGGFKEAKEKLIRFEEDDPDVFEMFLGWLYRGHLPSKSFADDNDKFASWFDDTGLTMERCIDLYVFGDKYNVKQLRLDCIDELFRIANWENKSDLTKDDVVTFAFENLRDGDPMCQLITDIYCQFFDPAGDEYTCAPFLTSVWKRLAEDPWDTSNVDLKKRSYKKSKEEWVFVRELCYYHDHADEEEKHTCQERQREDSEPRKVARPRKKTKVSVGTDPRDDHV